MFLSNLGDKKQMKEKIFKYLKTVFLCILIVSFLTGLVSFFSHLKDYLTPREIVKNPLDSNLISYANDVEKELDNLTYDMTSNYGEDYPAFGIVYYRAVLHYSSVSVIQNFLFGIIAGFGLGNIIYIVFIAKYKKLDLSIFFIISLFVTSVLFGLSDMFTNYANNEKIGFVFADILWNMETVGIPYFITTFVLMIIQKISSTYIEIRNS